MHYSASLPEGFVDELWECPEVVLENGELLRRTQYRAAVLVESGSQTFVLKHYFRRSLRYSLKQTIFGSQAMRSFNVGCVLANSGIRTPRPMACIDNRWRGLQRDCFLLYPHVDGVSLRRSINLGYMNDADIARTWRKLQSLWEQLTSLRVGLKDANTGNFIVTSNGTLWLIDLDDCRIHRSSVVCRARLQNRWRQVYRSVLQAMRARDREKQLLLRTA
jgi:hypothetical protein